MTSPSQQWSTLCPYAGVCGAPAHIQLHADGSIWLVRQLVLMLLCTQIDHEPKQATVNKAYYKIRHSFHIVAHKQLSPTHDRCHFSLVCPFLWCDCTTQAGSHFPIHVLCIHQVDNSLWRLKYDVPGMCDSVHREAECFDSSHIKAQSSHYNTSLPHRPHQYLGRAICAHGHDLLPNILTLTTVDWFHKEEIDFLVAWSNSPGLQT